MGKRKRPKTEGLEDKLPEYREELFRALKKVKGFERQRQSRHLHDSAVPLAKQRRLENEALVLKSLDLHQTANHYLCSALTRISSIANHPNFPDELRNPPPKPDLAEDERVALHHVTSSLFNRIEVKEAIDKILVEVCGLLDVRMPEKKRKRKRAQDYVAENQGHGGNETIGVMNDDSNVNGVPVSEPGRGKKLKRTVADRIDEAEQQVLQSFDSRLGGSSDEESSDGDAEYSDGGAQAGQKPRSIQVRGVSVSLSPEPEPLKQATRTKSRSSKEQRPSGPPGNSLFLPTLMGGYISGSESASDVDIAPPKKRLGQKQRRQRAEKKHGTNANHLKRPAAGRGDGWDMRRGAVGEEDGPRKPWKQGVRDPLASKSSDHGGDLATVSSRKAATKTDDTPLHPSWVARQKAKEAAPRLTISKEPTNSNKIVFGD